MTLAQTHPYLPANAPASCSRCANLLKLLGALTASLFVAGSVAAATQRIDESELLAAGFKVLVPTTKAQVDWVQRLAPGEIRPMQRTGKKFFICPDASGKQLYVGGPKEYEAYRQLHPDTKLAGQDAAKKGNAYRSKQDEVMKKATARDLSNPYLGLSWYDLGW